MAFKSLFTLGSLAIVAMGHAIHKEDCAAPPPTEEHIAIAKEMGLNETMFANEGFSLQAQANVEVPVYIHVVAKSKSSSDGYASENIVRGAIDDMNYSYRNMGFHFTVKDIDWTVNSVWAKDGDEMAMKRQLRKGDYKTLNLYYINDLGGPNGYCYFPAKGASSGSTTLIQDGCSIQTSTIAGKQTTPHEVGHWLGLYHTFQNGCGDNGDYVDDTPACQKGWSCDTSKDSCPDLPGNDPVTNLMSYGTCRDVFTYGQGVRMRSSFDYYRA